MKLLTLIFALAATLIAQPACALVINVAPNGSASATLADIKKNPNAAVSLTQALALLKDPTLRTPSAPVAASAATVPPGVEGRVSHEAAAPVGASAAGEPANSTEPFALI